MALFPWYSLFPLISWVCTIYTFFYFCVSLLPYCIHLIQLYVAAIFLYFSAVLLPDIIRIVFHSFFAMPKGRGKAKIDKCAVAKANGYIRGVNHKKDSMRNEYKYLDETIEFQDRFRQIIRLLVLRICLVQSQFS